MITYYSSLYIVSFTVLLFTKSIACVLIVLSIIKAFSIQFLYWRRNYNTIQYSLSILCSTIKMYFLIQKH